MDSVYLSAGTEVLVAKLQLRRVKRFCSNQIAASIEKKYPEIEMIVLLVNERPEGLLDMRSSLVLR